MALLRHAGGRVVRGGGPRGTGAPDNLMLSPWRNPQQLDEFSAFLGRLRRVAVVLCCVPSPVGGLYPRTSDTSLQGDCTGQAI